MSESNSEGTATSRRWMLYTLISLGVIGAAAGVFIPKALHRGVPYLQIVGHEAPAGAAPLVVGRGRTADLRLTEPNIDENHGWIVPAANGFRYVHRSLIHSASIPGSHPFRSSVETGEGDTITVRRAGQSESVVLRLYRGQQITLRTTQGNHLVTVPRKEGASVPLGDSSGKPRLWLAWCNDNVVWSVDGTCESPIPFASYVATWTGRVIDAPLPSDVDRPAWLENPRVVFGSTADNVFAQVGTGPLERLPGMAEASLTEGQRSYQLWRRSSGDVVIARAAAPDVRVSVRHSKPSDERPLEEIVGEVTAPYGTLLVVGSTAFRVDRDGILLRVTAVERPDRFHFFLSLSDGRLNFTSRVRPIGEGSAGDRVSIIGTADRSADLPVEPTVEAAAHGLDTWTLPMPLPHQAQWMIAGSSARVVGDVDLLPGRDEIVLTTYGAGAARRRIADGGRFQLMGHVFEFHRRVPLFEQTVPLVCFALAAFLVSVWLARFLDTTTKGTADGDPFPQVVRVAIILVVSLITALLIAGVALMSHMASVDTLIGKADYYHRQLFYSFVTITIIASILITEGKSETNPALAVFRALGFPISATLLVRCGLLLIAWQIVDAIAWTAYVGAPRWEDPIVQSVVTFGALLAAAVAWLYAACVARSTRKAIFGFIASALLVLALVRAERLTMIAFAVVVIAASVLLVVRLLADLPDQDDDAESPRSWWQRIRESAIHWTHWVVATYRRETSSPMVLLTVGFLMLLAGLGLKSERGAGGVKPAEFAIWFLALGLTYFLNARFQPTRVSATQRRLVLVLWIGGILSVLALILAWSLLYLFPATAVWVVPPVLAVLAHGFMTYRSTRSVRGRSTAALAVLALWWPVMAMLTLIELAVIILYGSQGDFGPLLVLMPSIFVVVVCWTLAPEPTAGSAGWARVLAPVMILLTFAWLGYSGYLLINSELAGRFPAFEPSLARAAKRLDTFFEMWFTKEGSWSVLAQWLANGYFGEREPMIANLHSDLAFVAALRTFGVGFGATTLFALYSAIIAIPVGVAWVLIRKSAPRAHSSEETRARNEASEITARIESRETALLLVFASIYLVIEVAIHVGSGFNMVPQTGVTLPWVSSGGSAAVAFGGLFAIVLAKAISLVRVTP